MALKKKEVLHTFVVSASKGSYPNEWRGTISYPALGEEAKFENAQELFSLIAEVICEEETQQ